MYVLFFEIFIYLRVSFYLATKLWALRINKSVNVYYWKNKKVHSQKNVGPFSLKPFKNAHDTIQWLKNVVHYLNMKMKDIFVEIIDLQLFSSLKWDGA